VNLDLRADYIRTCVYTNTHIHTCMHTYIMHTYIHMYPFWNGGIWELMSVCLTQKYTAHTNTHNICAYIIYIYIYICVYIYIYMYRCIAIGEGRSKS
jgi:hypothetical protein